METSKNTEKRENLLIWLVIVVFFFSLFCLPIYCSLCNFRCSTFPTDNSIRWKKYLFARFNSIYVLRHLLFLALPIFWTVFMFLGSIQPNMSLCFAQNWMNSRKSPRNKTFKSHHHYYYYYKRCIFPWFLRHTIFGTLEISVLTLPYNLLGSLLHSV